MKNSLELASNSSNTSGDLSLEEVVFELDKNNNFIFLNNKAEQFWSKSSKELIDKNIWKEYPFLRYSEFHQAIEEGTKNYHPTTIDVLFKETNTYYSVQIIPTSAGISIVLKEKVKEEPTFLQSVINASLSTINVFKTIRDENNSIIDFEWIMTNSKGMRLAGDKNLIGKRYGEVYPGIKHTDVFSNYIKVVEENIPADFELHYTLDGFNNWYHIVATKFNDGLLVSSVEITERKKAQLELSKTKEILARQVTDKYKVLFNSIDEGFVILEMLYDDNQTPIDFKYLETNPAFEKQTTRRNVLGKTFKEVAPTGEKEWIETFGKVAQTGQSIRFEGFSSTVNIWVDVYAASIGNNQVAVVLNDITERKNQELYNQFFSEINNEFSKHNTLDGISSAIGKIIYKHFTIKAAWCADIDVTNDSAFIHLLYQDKKTFPVPSKLKLSDFISEDIITLCKRREPIIINNSQTDKRVFSAALRSINLTSCIAIPFLDKEEWKYILSIVDEKPRNWSSFEIKLFQDLANILFPRFKRIIAEEALRISENKNSFIIKLNDRLRTISDPIKIQLEACRILGEHLDADRAYYYEYDSDLAQGIIYQDYFRNGTKSMAGTYHMEDFPGAHKILHTGYLIFEDASTAFDLSEAERIYLPTQLNIVSLVNIPLIKENKLIGVLGVCDSKKRQWTDFEISLVRETAERTWAILGKTIAEEALRKNEKKQALLLKISDTIRPLNSSLKIQEATCNILGEHLKVDYVNYSELEGNEFVIRYSYSPKTIPLHLRATIGTFAQGLVENYQRGESIIINNIDTDTRIGEDEKKVFHNNEIKALLGIRIMKEGKWVASLEFNHKTPRKWTKYEIELLEEVGNRIEDSLERARAEEALKNIEKHYRFNLEKKVEERTAQLKESKHLLQGIINAPNIGIAVYKAIRDTNGTIIDFIHEFVNERTKQFINQDPTGSKLSENGTDGHEQISTFAEVLKTGKHNSYVRHMQLESEEYWFLFNNAKLDNARVIHVWDDITEVKKAERDLRENKELLESIFETSLQGMMVADRIRDEKGEIVDYRFKLQNLRSKDLLNMDIRGKLLSEVQLFGKDLNYIDQLLENKQMVDYERYFENSNTKGWFRTTAVKLGDGMAIGFDNITKRKEQELELKETHEKLIAITNITPDIIYLFDIVKNKVVFINERARELFGMSQEELMNLTTSPFTHFCHPDDKIKRLDHILQFSNLEENELKSIDIRIKKFDGTYRWFRIRDRIFKKELNGSISQILGVGQDITEQKNAEEELLNFKLAQQKETLKAVLNAQEEERKKIAESLHNGLGQMLYSIRIRLASMNLEENMIEPLSQRQEIDKLLEQAIDITRNISLLLTPELLEIFGLKEAIQSMINKLISENLWIKLKYSSQSNLESELAIAIFRIIQELLNNIVKHSQASIGNITLDIEKSRIHLEVKDNGEGIKIKQGAAPKGIGLRMIENRVKLLNGNMVIQSNPEKGTKITIIIQR